MLTQARLKAVLDYDRHTGIFTWLRRNDLTPQWNGRYAGTIAGCDRGNGYVKIAIDDRSYHAHRLAWLYEHGTLPVLIDHRDGDPSNNRIANLREATQTQNMRNIGKAARNRSGFKGVSWHPQRRKWTVRAKAGGKNLYHGLYDTAEEAAAAYDEWIKTVHGDFARPNGVERGSTAKSEAA